jgi:hypothetical protein
MDGLCEGLHENKGVSMEMTSDRREWKKKTCCADTTKWDKGTMMTMSTEWR